MFSISASSISLLHFNHYVQWTIYCFKFPDIRTEITL